MSEIKEPQATTSDTKKNIIFRMTLSPTEQKQAQFLMDNMLITNVQTLFRSLMTQAYTKLRDTELRYGMKVNPSKLRKEEQESQIEELRLMSSEDLTAWLVGVEYIPEPDIDELSGNRHYWTIEERPNGKVLIEVYDNVKDPARGGSRSERLLWNELINDLKKEKKL